MMMESSPLLQKLTEYYQSQSIYSLNFHCPHYRECSQGSDSFTEARSAFVASGYERHEVPRLMVLSADPGSGWNKAEHRTPEYLRYHEEKVYQLWEGRTNQHWYQTHYLVYLLLSPFIPNMIITDAKHYFAHVNAAKCSQNNPGRSQASDRLFKNCYRYVKGELDILEPDILVTQGDKAKQCIFALYEPNEFVDNYFDSESVLPDEAKIIRTGKNIILWLQMYHPNQRQSFYKKKNMPKMPLYRTLIKQFLAKKDARWK